MRRREFITLLGGAAAAWPFAARAQQGERVRRIGLLTNLSQSDPEGQARDEAFRAGVTAIGLGRGRQFADRAPIHRRRPRARTRGMRGSWWRSLPTSC